MSLASMPLPAARARSLAFGALCVALIAVLALIGVLMQGALRNGLAETSLLGAASGASPVVATIIVFAAWATRDPVRMILIGAAMAQLLTREVARRLSRLPQAPAAPGAATLRELAEQERFPRIGALVLLRRQDHAAIGEALAQDMPWRLLDDSTTVLDIGHQFEVLTADLLRKVFRIEAVILRDEAATPPQIVPLRYLKPQAGKEAA